MESRIWELELRISELETVTRTSSNITQVQEEAAVSSSVIPVQTDVTDAMDRMRQRYEEQMLDISRRLEAAQDAQEQQRAII